MKSVSVIIPVNNEEENLPILLERLIDFESQNGFSIQIIIVNDGSQDSTGEIANRYSMEHENIRVTHNMGIRKGMGCSLKSGTREAQSPHVIWLMGDLADDINTIPKILKKLEDGYDVVVASRYMRGGSPGDMDPIKSFLSRSYSFFMRIIFNLPVHDINNAFRGFRREVFEAIEIKSDDFAISPEFAIKAKLDKFRLGEVPTKYFDRTFGKNKFKTLAMILRYSSILRYRIPWLRNT